MVDHNTFRRALLAAVDRETAGHEPQQAAVAVAGTALALFCVSLAKCPDPAVTLAAAMDTIVIAAKAAGINLREDELHRARTERVH